MRRRTLLARVALGTAATTSFAGCLSTAGGDGLGLFDGDGTRLARVTLLNQDDVDHTVDFRVRWADELVHDSSNRFAADNGPGTGDSGATLDRTWPNDPGQFTLAARVDGGEWRRVAPEDWNRPSCLGVFVPVDRNGRVAIFGSTNEKECSAERLGGSEERTAESETKR